MPGEQEREAVSRAEFDTALGAVLGVVGLALVARGRLGDERLELLAQLLVFLAALICLTRGLMTRRT